MSNNFKPFLKRVKYTHVFLTASGVGLKFLLPIRETFYLNNHWKYLIHFYLYALFSYFTKPKVRLKRGDYVSIHSHWSRGYHHWLSEVLMKIPHIQQKLSDLTLVLPEDYPDFAYQSLEAFSFNKVQKIPTGHAIQAKEMLLIENPYSGTFNPRDIASLRSFYWNHYQCSPSPQLNLYISRASVPYRRVSNEDEVIAFLQSRNFQVVYPEKMSFGEQVKLFSQCAQLVSIHGAGLTNCIFMPKGSQILEFYRDLSGKQEKQNFCFQHLAEACGLPYTIQFCPENENRSPKPNDADVVVDLSQLAANLSHMMDTLPREVS